MSITLLGSCQSCQGRSITLSLVQDVALSRRDVELELVLCDSISSIVWLNPKDL